MATWQKDNRVRRLRKQIEQLVAAHGWAVQGVFADPAAGEPTFSYTVGLYRTHKHPELVVFGVSPEVAKTILNRVAFRFAKEGEPIVPGVRYDEILEGFPVVFVTAGQDGVDSHLYAYEWFYKGQTPPVLQMVWPDTDGRFPWEDGFDRRFDAAQPLLGTPPAAH
jgi:hypothetical protein